MARLKRNESEFEDKRLTKKASNPTSEVGTSRENLPVITGSNRPSYVGSHDTPETYMQNIPEDEIDGYNHLSGPPPDEIYGNLPSRNMTLNRNQSVLTTHTEAHIIRNLSEVNLPQPGNHPALNANHSHISSIQPKKPKNERTDVNVFASNVTMHGVYHIFASHNIPMRRFIWSVFFIFALTIFLYNCINRFSLYYSYPHVTAIEESSNANKTLRFPQITFCNLNNYRWRVFQPEDLIYSNDLTGLLKWDPTIEEYKLNAPKSSQKRDQDLISYLSSLLSLANMFGLRFPAEEFNLVEFSGRTGHQLNDTVLACTYRGEPCDMGRFETVMTRFGKCYTFNSFQEKYQNKLLETLKGGIDNGLELLLDVQSTEYMPVWTETDEVSSEMGFKVQIHGQSEPALITELGFGISPGFQTLVTTKEQRITFLPSPWGECTANSEPVPGFEQQFPEYSVSACRLACEANYINKTCGCKMVHTPPGYNVTTCRPSQYQNCADPTLDWLVEKDQSEF